jgi:hypothetical protein
MPSEDLSPLFTGSATEGLLFALYGHLLPPRNDAQRTFHDAWEAFQIVHSDGFEVLLESRTPLEAYASAFGKMGLPHIPPIFSRVLALIPPELRQPQNEDALYEYLRSRFDELAVLASEFWDACRDFVAIAGRYVREHRADFQEYVET